MQFWSELLPELVLVLVLEPVLEVVLAFDVLPLELLLVLELCDVAAAATFSTCVPPVVLLASAATTWAVCVGTAASPKIQVHTPLSQPQKPPLLLDALGEAEADALAEADAVALEPAELLADEDALVFTAFADLPVDEEEALGVPVLVALGDAVVLDALAELDALADVAAL